MLEYPIARAPPNDGPFIADVLCTIFLFVADKSTLLAVSSVNRMWRFYANYLPHWTMLNSGGKLFSPAIPRSRQARAAVENAALPRDDTFAIVRSEKENAAKKEQAKQRYDCIVRALQQILLYGFVLGLIAPSWFSAWYIGYTSPSTNDSGSILLIFITHVAIACVSLLWMALVRRKIAVFFFDPTLLAIVLTLAFMMGCPTTMLAARLRSAELVVEGRSASLAEIAGVPESWAGGSPNSAEPTSSAPPSYVTLPAAVADGWELLWRDAPIDSASVADVCCMPQMDNLCFVLLRLTSLSPAAVALADSQSCAATAAAAVANGTVARGSLLAAVVGGSRGVPHVHQAARATALSYRSLRRTPFFNADRPWGVAGEYYSETNVLWRDARVPLVDVGWREGIAEGRERVRSLETSRDALGLTTAVAIPAFVVLPRLLLDHGTCTKFFVFLVVALFNPVVFWVWGTMCALVDDSSPARDGRWLMCNRGFGLGLVYAGIILLFTYFFGIVGMLTGHAKYPMRFTFRRDISGHSRH